MSFHSEKENKKYTEHLHWLSLTLKDGFAEWSLHKTVGNERVIFKAFFCFCVLKELFGGLDEGREGNMQIQERLNI